jgi:TP901-1 family phage major tail protein
MADVVTKIKGLEVLLYVGGNVVAGQRGASLSMSADELDITDKTTRGYKAFLVGLKEWTISCDGLVCTGDTGYDALVAKFLAGDTIGIELKAEDSEGKVIFGYSGEVAIASMDFDAQYDDALTYSCELKGASALVNMLADGE